MGTGSKAEEAWNKSLTAISAEVKDKLNSAFTSP
jgi:hypothetical protein